MLCSSPAPPRHDNIIITIQQKAHKDANITTTSEKCYCSIISSSSPRHPITTYQPETLPRYIIMLIHDVISLWLIAACTLLDKTYAFSSSSSLLTSPTQQASTTMTLRAADEENRDSDGQPKNNNNPCGEGFYPVQGEHGEVCVFDYEAAANSFGIATKEQEFVCDANDYWKELEDRNQIRKKFGMAPLTPEQFVVLQAQIVEMEMKGQEQLAAAKQIRRERQEEEAAVAAALLAANDGKDRNNSVLKDFFRLFQDTCESNYDCNRPMVCCDFGFKRQCCDGGKTAKSLYGEYAMIPIPQSID